MTKLLELLRLSLIKWNVAPLGVVGFLCWCVWFLLTNTIKSSVCTIDPIVAGGAFTLIATICGLLYKVYDSMQKDRVNKND